MKIVNGLIELSGYVTLLLPLVVRSVNSVENEKEYYEFDELNHSSLNTEVSTKKEEMRNQNEAMLNGSLIRASGNVTSTSATVVAGNKTATFNGTKQATLTTPYWEVTTGVIDLNTLPGSGPRSVSSTVDQNESLTTTLDVKTVATFPIAHSRGNNKTKPTYISSLIRVVCHFNSSSIHRPGRYQFQIQNLSASLCTDLYYDHATINDNTHDIAAISQLDIFPLDGNLYLPRFIAINDFKISHPMLRTFLTVTESTNVSFYSIIKDSKKLRMFALSCCRQSRTWGFDGVNIKWEGIVRLGHLVSMMKELRKAFIEDLSARKYPKLLLGVTLSGDPTRFDDLVMLSMLSRLVDQMTWLAFNPFEYTSGKTRISSPLFAPNASFSAARFVTGNATRNSSKVEEEVAGGLNLTINGNSSLDTPEITNVSTNKHLHHSSDAKASVKSFVEKRDVYDSVDINLHDTMAVLVANGVDKTKINIALTLTGQSFTLQDSNNYGIGAPAIGPARLFEKFGEVYFSDTCQLPRSNSMTSSIGDKTRFWHANITWVSYEDMDSLRQKVQYAMDQRFGGVMLLSQSEDDFTGRACRLGHLPVSKMVYTMSDVAHSFGHYEYSFPWSQFCGFEPQVISSPCLVIFSLLVYLTYYESMTIC